ncbi:MAG: sialate O-acetylesterase [Gemmatimonadaceae bacterium]
MSLRLPVATLLITALSAPPSAAHGQSSPETLRVSRLMGDGMVMQRGRPVPVWGWSRPGSRITVTFDGQPRTVTAAASGAWKAVLPPMPAGGPHSMTIAAGTRTINVRDVLVGDVWIASGQSNMEFTVADTKNAALEIAAARDSGIRQFRVPKSYADAPADDLAGGTWTVADSQHVPGFTAVGYFFARDLRKSVRVPIGILHTSWGGSRIEPWMSREALKRASSAEAVRLSNARRIEIMDAERAHEQRMRDSLRARIGDLPAVDAGLVEGQALWAATALDDSHWETIVTPKTWEQAGYDGMDGVAWYRTTFTLTGQEASRGVRLGLGTIDDSDVSWVNGVEVGRTSLAWNRARVYDVPPSALHAGSNVIAVRVEDTGGDGGIYGDPALLFVESNGVRRALAGDWRFKVGAVSVSPDGQHANQIPSVLYNQMIHPLTRYPIAGALWYQGESNADRLEDAAAYRPLFATLIRSWRSEWGLGDFPFFWVQLANYMAPDTAPVAQSAWATLREAQSAALTLPRTGQAVIIDLGDEKDIHPRNKQDVGARLAFAALKVAYGQPVVASGPTYRSHEKRSAAIAIRFANVGGGLVSRSAPEHPAGFAIAGKDRRFVWADARIEGDRVVVSSAFVTNPVSVRYAWGNNPNTASLYNREGLPASPFRTDTWVGSPRAATSSRTGASTKKG